MMQEMKNKFLPLQGLSTTKQLQAVLRGLKELRKYFDHHEDSLLTHENHSIV